MSYFYISFINSINTPKHFLVPLTGSPLTSPRTRESRQSHWIIQRSRPGMAGAHCAAQEVTVMVWWCDGVMVWWCPGRLLTSSVDYWQPCWQVRVHGWLRLLIILFWQWSPFYSSKQTLQNSLYHLLTKVPCRLQYNPQPATGARQRPTFWCTTEGSSQQYFLIRNNFGQLSSTKFHLNSNAIFPLLMDCGRASLAECG